MIQNPCRFVHCSGIIYYLSSLLLVSYYIFLTHHHSSPFSKKCPIQSCSIQSLEHIVWPHVKTEILKQINEIKQQSASCTSTKHPVIVLEAAVLLDAGWDDLLDGVWVIQAPRDVAVERLIEYRSFTREDAEKRMDAQTSRRGIGNIDQEVKNGAVTAIVENTAGVEDLKIALLEKLQDSTAWKMSSD